jgi:hypothetical protein
MHYIHLEPSMTSVKLYPRLAMTSRPHKSKQGRQLSGGRSRPNCVAEEGDTAHREVRTRLLRMILENERIRRYEQRPNAS